MKSLLVILAACASPTECIPSSVEGTVLEYPRLVDCVRAKATVEAQYEVYCTGSPFYPPHVPRG